MICTVQDKILEWRWLIYRMTIAALHNEPVRDNWVELTQGLPHLCLLCIVLLTWEIANCTEWCVSWQSGEKWLISRIPILTLSLLITGYCQLAFTDCNVITIYLCDLCLWLYINWSIQNTRQMKYNSNIIRRHLITLCYIVTAVVHY